MGFNSSAIQERTVIRSDQEPDNKQVLWIDTSGTTPVLKQFDGNDFVKVADISWAEVSQKPESTAISDRIGGYSQQSTISATHGPVGSNSWTHTRELDTSTIIDGIKWTYRDPNAPYNRAELESVAVRNQETGNYVTLSGTRNNNTTQEDTLTGAKYDQIRVVFYQENTEQEYTYNFDYQTHTPHLTEHSHQI